MEQSTERKLLYYDRFQRMPRHYNGAPIFHFMCKDVKTGEDPNPTPAPTVEPAQTPDPSPAPEQPEQPDQPDHED